MKTSIIILNYKTFDKTIKCLDNLLIDKKVIERIIIIDNASQNNSLDYIEKYIKTQGRDYEYINHPGQLSSSYYLLFQNSENTGYARGNNLGIDIALNHDATSILVINNDIYIKSNAIISMLNTLEKFADSGCVGPIIHEKNSYDINFARNRPKWYDYFLLSGIGKRLLPFKSLLRHHFWAYRKLPEHDFEVDILSGSCIIFHRRVFENIRGFDDNTFLFYEEAILSELLRPYNLKSYVSVSSHVEHEHAGSIKKIKPTVILKHSLESQYYYLTSVRKYNPLIGRLLMLGQYITYFVSWITEKIK